MAQYTVTWGDETKLVYAESEDAAWADFAAGNDLAMRHPHLHERTCSPCSDMQEFIDSEVIIDDPVA